MNKKHYFSQADSTALHHSKNLTVSSSVKPDEFYFFIGKITLMHAGIEQDIRGVLTEDWGIPDHEVDGRYGFQLRTFFLDTIKRLCIPENHYNEYSIIIERFWEASKRRNDLIKGVYGLTNPTREVFKYDLKARGKYDYKMDLKEWLRKGSRIISPEELKALISDLAEIRKDNFQLSRRVFLERKQGREENGT